MLYLKYFDIFRVKDIRIVPGRARQEYFRVVHSIYKLLSVKKFNKKSHGENSHFALMN